MFRRRLSSSVILWLRTSLLGLRKSERAEVEWVAEMAGLTEDIKSFPEGFDTMVGERGITLSGGQKQRTAIARAVLREPKILILDDALSSVDTYTEEKILGRLRGVMRDRTSLIVSHRVSTVRDADRICVLEEGRVVEQGTHAELLALGRRVCRALRTTIARGGTGDNLKHCRLPIAD